ALNFIINYSFIRFGTGIEGVALGTGISYFVFCSTLLGYTMKQYKSTFEEYIKFFFMIYAPFAYSLFLIITMDHLFSFSHDGFWTDLKFTIIILIFFSVSYSVILFFVRKQSAFVKLRKNLHIKMFDRQKT
ncbi:unnamed protein product, partial [marine sediment metagenome]